MKNRSSILIVAAIALALVLSVSLVAGAVAPVWTATQNETVPRAQSADREQAEQAVLNHLDDPQAVITEIDRDDGVYEVEAVSGGVEYDFRVTADGEILRTKTEPVTPAAPEAAVDAVKSHLEDPDARITDVDFDDGIWEMEVISGGVEYDFEVTPEGEIRRVEQERLPVAPPEVTVPAQPEGQDAVIAAVRAYLNHPQAQILEIERDDGIYEVEVRSGGREYDFEVAPDGTILEVEIDD